VLLQGDREMDQIVELESDRGFPYDSVDAQIADQLRRTTGMVAQEVRRQSRSILRVGQLLLNIKPSLEHGVFTRYVKSELPFTLRTAENYMRAAGLLAGSKTEIVSLLSPIAMYALAARTMPEDTRARTLAALAAEGADIRSIEADIGSARLSSKKSAAVSEGVDRAALQEIAGLLWSNLRPDAYQRLCELIPTVSGQKGSLRDLWKVMIDRQR
jgi:hypothetical protein